MVIKCSLCGTEITDCDDCNSVFHRGDDIMHISKDEHDCLIEKDRIEETGGEWEEAQAIEDEAMQ